VGGRKIKCCLPEGQRSGGVAEPLDVEHRQHRAQPVMIHENVRARHSALVEIQHSIRVAGLEMM
jgi:hypothetical protein